MMHKFSIWGLESFRQLCTKGPVSHRVAVPRFLPARVSHVPATKGSAPSERASGQLWRRWRTRLSLVSPQGLWGLGQGPTRLLAGKLGGAPVSSLLWKWTGVASSLRLPPAPALRGALIPSYCLFFFFNQFFLGISNSQLSSPFSKSV